MYNINRKKLIIFSISAILVISIGAMVYIKDKKAKDVKKYALLASEITERTKLINELESTKATTNTDLELIDKTTVYDKESDTMYIVGHIKNNTSKDYTTLYVSFDLIDNNGIKVGDAMDSINGLSPYGTWEFKASSSVAFTHYKISQINGY